MVPGDDGDHPHSRWRQVACGGEAHRRHTAGGCRVGDLADLALERRHAGCADDHTSMVVGVGGAAQHQRCREAHGVAGAAREDLDRRPERCQLLCIALTVDDPTSTALSPSSRASAPARSSNRSAITTVAAWPDHGCSVASPGPAAPPVTGAELLDLIAVLRRRPRCRRPARTPAVAVPARPPVARCDAGQARSRGLSTDEHAVAPTTSRCARLAPPRMGAIGREQAGRRPWPDDLAPDDLAPDEPAPRRACSR